MTFALTLAALRRHPFSMVCAALVALLSARLVGAAVPLALAAWLGLGVVSLEAWYVLEPLVLRRCGCRIPDQLERERLEAAVGCSHIEIFLLDSASIGLGRGLRSLVITRALFDLLEDRAFAGLLTQAVLPVHRASLAGDLVVRLGNLPVLTAWLVSRWLMRIGRGLATLLGTSLVLPVVLWPDGFVRWTGRLLGSVIVALLGSSFLSSGLADPGLGLLLAWAIGPAMQSLAAWETRRAEAAADQATIAAGFGWQLLEALEMLSLVDSLPAPAGVLGWLAWVQSPVQPRADRIRRTLDTP